MSLKDHAIVSSVIFLIVFVLHALRIYFNWGAMVGGWEVPMWFSWLAVVLTGYLAYTGFSVGGFIGKK